MISAPFAFCRHAVLVMCAGMIHLTNGRLCYWVARQIDQTTRTTSPPCQQARHIVVAQVSSRMFIMDDGAPVARSNSPAMPAGGS